MKARQLTSTSPHASQATGRPARPWGDAACGRHDFDNLGYLPGHATNGCAPGRCCDGLPLRACAPRRVRVRDVWQVAPPAAQRLNAPRRPRLAFAHRRRQPGVLRRRARSRPCHARPHGLPARQGKQRPRLRWHAWGSNQAVPAQSVSSRSQPRTSAATFIWNNGIRALFPLVTPLGLGTAMHDDVVPP